jgi:transglutaminase-like putative cysteine protease
MSAVAATLRSSTVATERLLWTAAIVIGASLPHWLQLNAWIPALLCGCVAWRLAIAQLDWPLPPRPLRLLLAFAAFCAVLIQYRTINGVEAGSALLVVMVALKFLESRSQRDHLVLMMIAYFLMFASLLTERSPLTAAYLLLLVWVATVGLLQLGRHGPLLPSAATAKLAVRLLVQALPIMVALFVLFPRLPGPLWAIPGSTSSGATGLADTMSPGDITELGLSDEVAFRVEFLSRTPAANLLYWRGPTMTHFNGRTWSMAIGGRRGERVLDTIEHRGEPTEYRVMLEPNGRNWAFALDMPERWSGVRSLRMGSDYQLGLFFGGPRPGRLDYRVTSYTSYRAREPLNANERQLFRNLPPDSSPRTRALVAGWVEDNPAPREIIDRAMAYLASQPFFYTLTPPALGAQPVDEFLLDTREGFCEHYASAFAVMMRIAGLPARVVTGYQGGEINSLAKYHIIRQSDAHAWTEVWLEDDGWVRVDPIVAVAPERVALGFTSVRDGSTPGVAFRRLEWVRNALYVWDAANTYWRTWVLGYGPELQRALLDLVGLDNPRRAERWATLMALSVAATVAMLLALGIYLAWTRRERRAVDAAAQLFAAFGRRLSRRRVPPRAPTEGPVAYAARAGRQLPDEAAEIGAILGAYLRARYEPDMERVALAELRARVASFRPAKA